MSSILISGTNSFIIKDIYELGNIINRFNLNNDNVQFIGNLNEFSQRMNNSKTYARRIQGNIGESGGKVLRIRNFSDPLDKIFHHLSELPAIRDKNILTDSRFIELFYKIFWAILQGFGLSTVNLHDYIDDFINILNFVTVPNYVLYDCRSTNLYNCGRAMIPLPIPDNYYPSKFVIFNTGADQDVMDQNVIDSYYGIENPEFQVTSEDQIKNLINIYYSKYSKRIINELRKLNVYNIQVLETGLPRTPLEIVFKHQTKPVTVSLKLPIDYPYSKPFGVFNGYSISDTDINMSCRNKIDKPWLPICRIQNILEYLELKFDQGRFDQNILVPTRFSLQNLK